MVFWPKYNKYPISGSGSSENIDWINSTLDLNIKESEGFNYFYTDSLSPGDGYQIRANNYTLNVALYSYDPALVAVCIKDICCAGVPNGYAPCRIVKLACACS